jgi:hypothetical protein
MRASCWLRAEDLVLFECNWHRAKTVNPRPELKSYLSYLLTALLCSRGAERLSAIDSLQR